MQNLELNQSLLQKLSPQQIQFIKLLQIPTVSLEARVEQELEENPMLEIDSEIENSSTDELDKESESNKQEDDSDNPPENDRDDFNMEDYFRDDEVSDYKMKGDGTGYEDEDKDEMPLPMMTSLIDSLNSQLGFLRLNEKEKIIGDQLIGSIEEDGYIRRNLTSIKDDLAFGRNLYVTEEEIESVLKKIQTLEPAGIAARDLRECLLLQLHRKVEEEEVLIAREILNNLFDDFTKKHYDKIAGRLGINQNRLKDTIHLITKLNPKPGDTGGINKTVTVIPDFMVINNEGKLELSLNGKNAPVLRISNAFSDIMDSYKKGNKKDKKLKEAVTFVKQKLDSAKWFIDAIKQRQQTLLKTMEAILKYQYNYFQEGDESKLKPMILKDIAEKIKMDLSTVSRVVNSKYVQTDFGTIPLKYFFSEGIATDHGEDASSREVKKILKNQIEAEDKSKPLSDDILSKMLVEKGYTIARRTIAKYREQLNIPVARLRKEI